MEKSLKVFKVHVDHPTQRIGNPFESKEFSIKKHEEGARVSNNGKVFYLLRLSDSINYCIGGKVVASATFIATPSGFGLSFRGFRFIPVCKIHVGDLIQIPNVSKVSETLSVVKCWSRERNAELTLRISFNIQSGEFASISDVSTLGFEENQKCEDKTAEEDEEKTEVCGEGEELCTLCYKKVACVKYPCGHIVGCKVCEPKLKKRICTICRRPKNQNTETEKK